MKILVKGAGECNWGWGEVGGVGGGRVNISPLNPPMYLSQIWFKMNRTEPQGTIASLL